MQISTLLLQAPANSIEEVLGIMDAIEQGLPSSDGLWWFNHLNRDLPSGIVTVFEHMGGARDTAWTNAEVLWALKPTPRLQHDYFDRLDRFTGFAARGLLTPVGPSQH